MTITPINREVEFFATCLGDALKSRAMKCSVLLLEELGVRVHFAQRQTCCGQPTINSGYIDQSIPAIKNNIELFERSDLPIIVPAGSCAYTMKSYAKYLRDEPEWAARAEQVGARIMDLTTYIVKELGVVDVGARLPGRAVYHPSCSLTRKMHVTQEPLQLLEHVKYLELLPFEGEDTCCGFGGTFAVKMSEVSGAMVSEKVDNMMAVTPDYLIGADVSCLMNIEGRMRRIGSPVKVLHIAEVLMSR